MADFSLPVTVPDAKVDEFIEALRWHYQNDALTPAQLRDAVAVTVRNQLKGIYKDWRAYQLKINPPSDEIEIT